MNRDRNGILSIQPEHNFTIYQRSYLKGNVVKRNLQDMESAMIISIQSDCQLRTFTGEEIDWFPWEKLKRSIAIEVRDKVFYNNWVGSVEEVVDLAIIKKSNGKTYKFFDVAGVMQVGKKLSVCRSIEI
jgi:hypothetical protein